MGLGAALMGVGHDIMTGQATPLMAFIAACVVCVAAVIVLGYELTQRRNVARTLDQLIHANGLCGDCNGHGAHHKEPETMGFKPPEKATTPSVRFWKG